MNSCLVDTVSTCLGMFKREGDPKSPGFLLERQLWKMRVN